MKPVRCRGGRATRVRKAVVCSVLLAISAPALAEPPADQGTGPVGSALRISPNDIGVPPQILLSSFYGGGLTDTIKAIRVNAAGEIYVAGFTSSTDMQTTPGAQHFNGGGYRDGFVAKFSADGSHLIYATYIGTDKAEFITGLALDASGNAYVSGYVQATLNDPTDAFLVKVVDNGTGLTLTSRVFGGSANDSANDVVVTASGTVVVVGTTASASGFGSPNPISANLGGISDGFIRRYDSNLTLLSSTYLGGPGAQGINAVDVGGAGNITIAGWDANFGNTLDHHVWVARINAVASASIWSWAYRGDHEEEALDVRISAAGDALVGGWTTSTDYSTTYDPMAGTFPGFVQDWSGYKDGFLLIAASADGALRYSSYIGGPGIDFVRAVERAANGDIVVIGDFQPDPKHEESKDAFLARFNNVLQVPQSVDYLATFGSSSSDYGWALTRTANGAVYIAGSVGASDFYTTPGAFLTTKPGVDSSFFMRLADPNEIPDAIFKSGFE